MKYFQDVPPVLDLVVGISGVVGGVFMAAKVVDMLFFNIVRKWLGRKQK